MLFEGSFQDSYLTRVVGVMLNQSMERDVT